MKRTIQIIIVTSLIILPNILALQAQSFEAVDNFYELSYSADNGSVVVGRRFGDEGTLEPALLVNGETVNLAPPAGNWIVTGVSGDGKVLYGVATIQNSGYFPNCNGGYTSCYLPFQYKWDEDETTFELLSFPQDLANATRSNMYGMNASADGKIIVATFRLRNPFGVGKYYYYTFKWTEGVRETVNVREINTEGFATAYDITADGQTFVGNGFSSIGATRAMLFADTTLYLNIEGAAKSVTPNGKVIVGEAFFPDVARFEPFRWENGHVETLGYANPFATNSHGTQGLFSVYRDGSLAIGSEETRRLGDDPATEYPTIWTEEGGMRKLTDVLQSDYELDLSAFNLDPSLPSSVQFRAIYMSPDGVIVGHGPVDGIFPYKIIGWKAKIRPFDTSIKINSIADRSDSNTGDDICDTGQRVIIGESDLPECTLRAALETANAKAGRDKISFNIDGAGVHTISLTTALPALTEPLELDATTQPNYNGTPLIVLNGGGSDGLILNVGETTIRGLSIGGYSGAGIRISSAAGNIIEACHLGLNAAGTTATPNGIGISIENSPNNVIGGELAGTGNIISGNLEAGISIGGELATRNLILGNLIGLNLAGASAIANGAEGIVIQDAPGNLIGGNLPKLRNIISGNTTTGVLVLGEKSSKNKITGNYIGTDKTGKIAIGNGKEGIFIAQAPENQIGGITEGERNVISGNKFSGIFVAGIGADKTVIQGNFIGLNAGGTKDLGNGTETGDLNSHHGIYIKYANEVIIGGIGPAGNIISGNVGHGIFVSGSISGENAGPSNDLQILGNKIGLDHSGTVDLHNDDDGIFLWGEVRNAKIGQAGAGNTIVVNDQSGIRLWQKEASVGSPDGAHIADNVLGFSVDGGTKLGKMKIGITVFPINGDGGVKDVIIGGEEGEGNQIVASNAIYVAGRRARGSITIGSNTIGLLADGTIAGEENKSGVYGIVTLISDSLVIKNNTIGGQLFGVVLASNENQLFGNLIGTNPSGTLSRPNTIGILVPGEFVDQFGTASPVGDLNKIGGSSLAEANIISGNTQSGIYISSFPFEYAPSSGESSENLVRSVQNQLDKINAVVPNPFGIVSYNENNLPNISESFVPAPDSNTVAYNRIGINRLGTKEIGNGRSDTNDGASPGIFIQAGEGNAIIGNIIAGNGGGIAVTTGQDYFGKPENTIIAGNQVGLLTPAGKTIPNQHGGISINLASNTKVTAISLEENGEPVGNQFIGNNVFGVRVADDGEVGLNNVIQQSTFLLNGGPSILLLSSDQTYPETAPEPPALFRATTSNEQVTLRLLSKETGIIELYVSDHCEAGNADGTYVFAVEGAENTVGVMQFSFDQLLATNADDVAGKYLSATSTSAGGTATTSRFSDCIRISPEANLQTVSISEGETGEIVSGENGIIVDITENAAGKTSNQPFSSIQGSGNLFITRHDFAPHNTNFSDSTTAPDGSIVAPDIVASARYWTLVQEGSLSNIVYKSCLDITNLDSLKVPEQAVLLHRENPAADWISHVSTLELNNTLLCAEDISGLGDLAIGAKEAINPVPIEEEPVDIIPTAFNLSPAYPNPFNPTTNFNLDIAVSSHFTITVYDVAGRRIMTLLDDVLSAGGHLITFDAAHLPSGTYFIRLTSNEAGIYQTRTVTLMK